MPNREVIDLAMELIRRPSVTPADEGCQELVAKRLEPLGFTALRMPHGDASNLWLRRGTEDPLFAFAGHTDVVPPGPLEQWTVPPFEPRIEGGELYGRGASDMKGNVAALVVAAERFVRAHPDHRGSLAVLLTSAEEAFHELGTLRVVEYLAARGESITWCLVTEPSSSERLGDTVRVGRRGSLSGFLRVRGEQGHVAYVGPETNPVHLALPALAELAVREWDQGNEHFPPTGFHIADVRAGVGASNVVPGELEVRFNFRYSTELTSEEIRTWVDERLRREGLDYDLVWESDGLPFLTAGGELLSAAEAAVTEVTGIRDIVRSTGGGTSDGRFIAPTGAEVIELGLTNGTIHQVDERVPAEDLEVLSHLYQNLLERLLARV